eukprot:SAG31_NODE_1055_length_10134_cov_14.461837_6_plen_42_part_00
MAYLTEDEIEEVETNWQLRKDLKQTDWHSHPELFISRQNPG